MLDGLDRGFDEFRAIKRGADDDISRKAGADLFQPFTDALCNIPAVLALQHQRSTDDDFPAVGAGRAKTRGAAGFHDRHIHNADDLAGTHQDRCLRQFFHVAETGVSTDNISLASTTDIARAGDAIGVLKCIDQLDEPHAIGCKLRRVRVDRVFLHIAAKHINASDSFHAAQLWRDDPVLHRAKVGRLLQLRGQALTLWRDIGDAVTCDGICELDGPDIDLAEARNDRTSCGRQAFRQFLTRRLQALVHQVAGEVYVRRIGEDRSDLREAVARQGARFGEARKTGERGFQRIGNLAFDLFRAKRGRDRVDLHLPVRNVGHGVDGQAQKFACAKNGEDQHKQQNKPPAANGQVDDAIQHQ